MIYLDNGATSFPKPPGMTQKMKECMDKYCGNPGRSGHMMSLRTGEEVYKARKAVANVFGIRNPERLIFTSNTTTALNMGIKGVLSAGEYSEHARGESTGVKGYLSGGDHVVTTAMEHNSVLRPLKALETCGITHTIVGARPCGTVAPRDIINAIREDTRLVVMAHASNVTGTIQDIERVGQMICEINKKRSAGNKVLFMIDGAQSAGCVPIDVDAMHIDLLAVPGHKGLLGPLGTGALYAREGTIIYPTVEGGTGTASKEREQPLEFPEGFEAGTVNAPGIIGLGYSASWVHKCGVGNIRRYEEELISPLHEALMNMENVIVYGPQNPQDKTAVVAFNIMRAENGMEENFFASAQKSGLPGALAQESRMLSCEEVADLLAREYSIAVRGGFHCAGLAHKAIGTWETGAVRISAGPFNTKKEIRKAIDAIYNMQKI